MPLSDAIKLMRGKKGTPVTLTVARKGEAKPPSSSWCATSFAPCRSAAR